MDITVNGTTLSVNPNDTTYVYAFNGLSANGSNEIVMDFTSGTGDVSFINAMELTAVPEPSSVMLLGLGLLGCCFLRRR